MSGMNEGQIIQLTRSIMPQSLKPGNKEIKKIGWLFWRNR